VTGITRKNVYKQYHKTIKYIFPGDKKISFDELRDTFKKRKGKLVKKVTIGLVHNENKILWNEVSAAPVGIKGDYTAIITHDLTERMLLQKKISDNELKFKALFENSMDAIYFTSPDGTIHAANPAACILHQMTEKEICSRGREGVVDINDPRLAAALKIRSETGTFYGEINMVRSTGEIFPAEISTSVFTASDGRLFSSIIVRDITERKKAESKVNKVNEELRKLTRHLQESIENERRQIAKDLHDDLGQKLTALNLYCTWLKSKVTINSPDVENKISEIMTLLEESFESLHKISMGLRPGILDDLGLCPAIIWQVKHFIKSAGISCKVSFKPKEIQIDNKTSLVIFRTVQEALTNITKHSEATEAYVSLISASGLLKLVVRDNGVGIDTEKIYDPRSFGIAGMRERVEISGGTLNISRIKGKGTQVVVIIPLPDSKTV